MTVSTEAVARNSTGRVQEHYDVIVVGGGSAGLSGAKILARSCRSVLVVDAGAPRNLPAEGVHNYLYAEGTAPSQLARIGRAEARRYGVDVVEGTARAATAQNDPEPGTSRFTVEVTTGAGLSYLVGARRLLLATGLVDVLPDIPGLRERWGIDVLHCPFCHGWEVRGQAIGVLGTSPLALHQVLLFRQLSADVTYFQHTAPDPTQDQREQLAALGVEHIRGEVAEVVTTAGALSGLRMTDGRLLARQAVAVSTTVNGREDLVADLGLSMSDLLMGDFVAGRYLAADPSGLTTTPGVWVAGNVADPRAQVINSAASGASAGAMMHMDLMTEDTAIAVTALREKKASSGPNEWLSAAADAANCERLLGEPRHDNASGSPALDAASPAVRHRGVPTVQAEWDTRYAEREQLWSGQPNGALVAEVAGLAPGRVLDVGCGEGADAVWLASRGWGVTALEVSGVALERAAEHARDAGVAVNWVHAELAEAALPPASFDLVSAQYPALLRTPDAAAERALLAAVAPGGVLLLVHHAGINTQQVHDSGFDPANYVWPSMVAALLNDDWEVELNEQRPRVAPNDGAGAHHADDLVLRARRLR